MAAWLFTKQMEVEPGVFEHGPEYDVTVDDTVYVLDSSAGQLVGEFDPLPLVETSATGRPDQLRTKLVPDTEELLCLTDSQIVDLAEPESGPYLDSRLVEAFNHADPSATISPAEFFGASDPTPETTDPETGETTTDAEASQSLSLQRVFTRQEGREGVDFSGETVTGSKRLTETSLRGATLSDTSLQNVTFEDVNLRDVDFRGADLRGATFVGQHTQLSGADFTGARLDEVTFEVDVSNCTFTGAQMRDVDLRAATLEGADFSDARLKRAKLHGTNPLRATFDRAVMQNVKTKDARFEKASFVGADLSNTTFVETEFADTDFDDGDLRRVTFRDCTLADVTFVGATMRNLELEAHDTSNLNFERADLTGAQFKGSTFGSARFVGAILSDASFRDCDLGGAALTDVQADGANFVDANLEFATLSQADLTDATFTGARLYTCQLVSTRVGMGTQFDGIYDYTTERPSSDASEDHPQRKAASVYRTLEGVYRNNSMTVASLEYHRKRKNATLKANWDEGETIPALYGTLLKYTTSHGTKLWRLFTLSALVVIVGAGLQLWLGTLEHQTLGRLGIFEGGTTDLAEIGHALLFSLLSFTGLGYGRFTPVGTISETIAMGQSALGILFFGLLVFVLTTRASR